jgi:hypothetical protein
VRLTAYPTEGSSGHMTRLSAAHGGLLRCGIPTVSQLGAWVAVSRGVSSSSQRAQSMPVSMGGREPVGRRHNYLLSFAEVALIWLHRGEDGDGLLSRGCDTQTGVTLRRLTHRGGRGRNRPVDRHYG